MTSQTSDISIEVAVTRELVEMHQFFVTWFSGNCDQDRDLFDKHLSHHFDEAFQIVFPAGQTLTGPQLFDNMFAGFGSNPEFVIQIRNIELHPLDPRDRCVLATYEEWMKNAKQSDPPNNGRISTVVFVKDPNQPNGLRWRHVHETWLPKALMDADEFDF